MAGTSEPLDDLDASAVPGDVECALELLFSDAPLAEFFRMPVSFREPLSLSVTTLSLLLAPSPSGLPSASLSASSSNSASRSLPRLFLLSTSVSRS